MHISLSVQVKALKLLSPGADASPILLCCSTHCKSSNHHASSADLMAAPSMAGLATAERMWRMSRKLLAVNKVGIVMDPISMYCIVCGSNNCKGKTFMLAIQKSTVLLSESACCAEIPSFGGKQHTSPKTAGSQIAAGDEAAARVSCRAQWRRQAQPTVIQQPAAPQEHVWTLQAITVGKYHSCSS